MQQMQQMQQTQQISYQNIDENSARIEAQRQLQNPNLAQKFQQVMQNNQGKSYWEIADMLAKERGINLQNFIRSRR